MVPRPPHRDHGPPRGLLFHLGRGAAAVGGASGDHLTGGFPAEVSATHNDLVIVAVLAGASTISINTLEGRVRGVGEARSAVHARVL